MKDAPISFESLLFFLIVIINGERAYKDKTNYNKVGIRELYPVIKTIT